MKSIKTVMLTAFVTVLNRIIGVARKHVHSHFMNDFGLKNKPDLECMWLRVATPGEIEIRLPEPEILKSVNIDHYFDDDDDEFEGELLFTDNYYCYYFPLESAINSLAEAAIRNVAEAKQTQDKEAAREEFDRYIDGWLAEFKKMSATLKAAKKKIHN